MKDLFWIAPILQRLELGEGLLAEKLGDNVRGECTVLGEIKAAAGIQGDPVEGCGLLTQGGSTVVGDAEIECQ
ncbi:MAG: hypothetical protein GTO04_10910 [Planctomycetales bacterium]|nr:hypothetical protein [Planctomycetales bacterium]